MPFINFTAWFPFLFGCYTVIPHKGRLPSSRNLPLIIVLLIVLLIVLSIVLFIRSI